MRFLETSLLIALGTAASALKIGHISDLHLNLRYDPYWGPYMDGREGDCIVDQGIQTDVKAPMGRYGCDPPMILVETMLDAFVEHHGKQDVIILTGDFNAHHTAMNYAGTDDELENADQTFSILLAQHAGLTELLASKFPDTLVLPAFGNNDFEFHDNPIPDSVANFFNDYVYNLWFKLLPGNVRHLTNT